MKTYRICYVYYCDSFSCRTNDHLVDAEHAQAALSKADQTLYRPRMPKEQIEYESIEEWNGSQWVMIPLPDLP